jgi:hypothetical protein
VEQLARGLLVEDDRNILPSSGRVLPLVAAVELAPAHQGDASRCEVVRSDAQPEDGQQFFSPRPGRSHARIGLRLPGC